MVVGAVDTNTKQICLDIINERNSANLKIFVYNHIVPGTHIIHDGWSGYIFLNDDDSVYTEEEHNHGAGNFGHGALVHLILKEFGIELNQKLNSFIR